MRIKWIKVFFRLLSFELLAVELIGLLARGLRSFKAEMRRELATWAIKVAFALLLLGLAHCALLFGLVAMALYFNDLLDSSYQGFLVVSGGCVTLLLLLWWLKYAVHWIEKKR
jgi:hypothetical protein